MSDEQFKYTNQEILESLKRSGYLFESEISEYFYGHRYFTLNNQVIVDPISAKSREIDLIAERFDSVYGYDRTLDLCVKTQYVCEIKNNPVPFVLLSSFKESPLSEPYLAPKIASTHLKMITDPKYTQCYYDKIIDGWFGPVKTQYCSFQPKKKNEELMAIHPEFVHSGIQKITQWCEDELDSNAEFEELEEENTKKIVRHFLLCPTLIIKRDLYSYDDGNLSDIPFGVIVQNYHHKGEPRTAFIHVVTQAGLDEFLMKFNELESDIYRNLAIALRGK